MEYLVFPCKKSALCSEQQGAHAVPALAEQDLLARLAVHIGHVRAPRRAEAGGQICKNLLFDNMKQKK